MTWLSHLWSRVLVTLALAIDILLSSVWWRLFGVTISSHCGKALEASPAGTGFLCGLGRVLNWLNPGHCEAAIAGDIARAKAAIAWLDAKPQ